MVLLNKYEKLWVLLCKRQLKKYPWNGSWVETLKPLFTEIYGWNPDEDNNYNDYLRGVFFKLLEIQLKICDDKSGNNVQLKEIRMWNNGDEATIRFNQIRPYIEKISTENVKVKGAFINHFAFDINFIHNKYGFFVPSGSIKQEYNLDAK